MAKVLPMFHIGKVNILANETKQSLSETELVIKMLGRPPRTPFIVQTRCPDGTPQVLLADSVFLEDGIWKPFPTVLWLLCPRLKREVARVEESGAVKRFSEKLQMDEEFYKEFQNGQLQISEIRLKRAKEILPEKIPEHILDILSKTTIAGSVDYKGVKCLHSHVAQELAFHNNPIGREVLKEFGECNTNSLCMPSFAKGLKND